jgi:NADH-quinone oxidoreductase subunit L
MAATIGLTQFDIKKILAYSTVSQLGYMFLAVGVGAFGAGMFHLMTHAFFKALMFLGSGSVIHGMHEEQDIRKMGGLKKYMPITHFTFVLGWLAIIGMPPFAGFFSKDEILWQAYSSPRGHILLWVAGAVGAGLTAFYMTRLMALTFWGTSRVDKHVHPHESGSLMTIPLIVLGILSVIGGWVGIPHVISEVVGNVPNYWEHWLEPVLAKLPEAAGEGHAAHSAAEEWALMGVSVSIAALSALTAVYMYLKNKDAPKKFVESIAPVYKAVHNKYFVDEFYGKTVINPLVNGSRQLWFYVDVNVIDKATYKITDLVRGGGSFVRSIQNGNMQQYALYVIAGAAITLSLVLMR